MRPPIDSIPFIFYSSIFKNKNFRGVSVTYQYIFLWLPIVSDIDIHGNLSWTGYPTFLKKVHFHPKQGRLGWQFFSLFTFPWPLLFLSIICFLHFCWASVYSCAIQGRWDKKCEMALIHDGFSWLYLPHALPKALQERGFMEKVGLNGDLK